MLLPWRPKMVHREPCPTSGRRRGGDCSRRVRLFVELLEDRTLPSTDTWIGAVSGRWSGPGGWSNGAPPTAADIAVFNATGADYTVTLDVDATVAGFTLNSANATFAASGRTFTVNGVASLTA